MKGALRVGEESTEHKVYVSKRAHASLSRKAIIWIVAGAVLVVGILEYLLVSRLIDLNNKPSTEKVLTIDDLNNSKTEINSGTSDASVNNLEKELKAKIDKQIAAKQNPIDTVMTLVGVLCNTANSSRQSQCVDYITSFLDTKMDSLKLKSDTYGQPDQNQILYWKAQLYADLVFAYKFMMENKFVGSDGKTVDTTDMQLKYINHYLAIAQDRRNWGEPQTSQMDGHTWYYYEYKNTDQFVELRQQLETGVSR